MLRRITVELDEPTRNDEHEIHILTNVAPRIADAVRIAAVYRQRWTIENAFQELDQALRSEINTLCYPKAALLCFSIGVVLYNTMSVLKSAIRAEHPDAPPLSGYYLAVEISGDAPRHADCDSSAALDPHVRAAQFTANGEHTAKPRGQG